MSRTLILSPERVQWMLRRLAYEIVERNRGADGLQIFGIVRRGAAVGEALAEEIAATGAGPVPVFPLDTRPYRDDRAHPEETPPAQGKIDVTDRAVVLVDDVLFTGRTVRAALDAIVRYGRPRSIQLVVLIDRGHHREYPIQPDYVGRRLPTKHKERVIVEVDEGFAVYVEE